jgi:hypothetical protein
MKTFLNITGEFLRDVGRLGPRSLGPNEESHGAANSAALDERLSRYEARLTDAAMDSRRVIWAIIGVCSLIVIAAMALAVYFRNNPTLVGVLFGGSSGSTIVFAVTVMRTAWREKYQMDMLAGVLPLLPPEKGVEVIERWYFRTLEPTTGPSSRRRTTSQRPGRETSGPASSTADNGRQLKGKTGLSRPA